MNKKVCVIGLGYIGLPTAALLASKGCKVHGVDVSQDVVDIVNSGNIHIVEPDLKVYVKNAVNNGSLIACVQPVIADVFIIAVPTPFKDDYVPDIDYIISAIQAISPFLKDGNLVILESTSPVGTTHKIEQELKSNKVDTSKIYISYCPERVLPGNTIRELVQNDRIVGGVTKLSTKVTAEFYREFVSGGVLETNAKTAEMAKLTENSFRDVNIAFANELSLICDKLDIGTQELINLANRHPRVNILKPGVGVGGHCIAVDPWFIVDADKENSKLIKMAREVNEHKTKWVVEKIKNESLKFENTNSIKPTIACMGLAFKPNIDDLRESPALNVVKTLKSAGLNILAVEPNIDSYDEFEIVDLNNAIKEADIVVFLVAHNEFKGLNTEKWLDFCGIND